MNSDNGSSVVESISTVGREIYAGVSFGIRTSDKPHLLPEAIGQDIYQIIMITEGSVVLSDENSKSALLPPQLICLSYLNPMKRLEINEAKGFSIFFVPKVINFGLFNNFTDPATESKQSAKSASNESFLAEKLLIKPFKQGEISNPFHIAVNPVLQGRVTDMYKGLRDQFTLQPNQFWPCRGRSYFLEILMLLQNLYAFEGNSALDLPLPKGEPAIEEAVKIMLLHYSDTRFRMAEARGSLGALRFHRVFKKTTGMTPRAYLRLIRLTVAANLMRNTMLPPSDIATRSGYLSMRAFDRDFMRLHHKNPTDYRAAFPDPYG